VLVKMRSRLEGKYRRSRRSERMNAVFDRAYSLAVHNYHGAKAPAWARDFGACKQLK